MAFCAPVKLKPGVGKTRCEESGLPAQHRHPRASHVAGLAKVIAVRGEGPDLAFGDLLPERAQLAQSAMWWIAGDDRGVDRPDRDPRHPVRFDPRLVHGLIDAGLVGA